MPGQKKLTHEFVARLNSIAASGRGGRGVSALCRPEYWQTAASEFAVFHKVAIVSGFFVPAAGLPETDGPGGAVMLARAFLEQGIESEIWTDALCAPAIKNCAEAVNFPAGRVKVPDISRILELYRPDGVIFTERLGRASDGRYYNIAMKDVSLWTAPLDELALICARRNIKTLGIGDGGNEVGMGVFYDKLTEIVPRYASCLSVIKTNMVLPVDVSNWGAYALVAALSRLWGEWRGHKRGEEKAMLEALNAGGAVDGISLRRDLSVDGFPLSVQESVAVDSFELWCDNKN